MAISLGFCLHFSWFQLGYPLYRSIQRVYYCHSIVNHRSQWSLIQSFGRLFSVHTSFTRGVHPSEAMMHFPLFQISPLYFNNFQTLWKMLTFYHFPTKRFSSAKIYGDLLFSRRQQISNFPPIFPVSVHFPPVLRKLFVPLLWTIFPLF